MLCDAIGRAAPERTRRPGRRERDALAAEAAQAINVDLFVTERPYLFETKAAIGQGVALCRTAEALALVGLYLRSQNEFIIWQAADGRGGALTMNEGLYYQVGAVELLPQSWRWSAACSEASRTTGDETLSELYHSLLRRIQRVLKGRDSFHRAYNLPQNNNDTARAALTELDAILLSLMAAVDGTARVAHLVLGLPVGAHRAGWQYDQKWLPQVAKQAPALAALFDPGMPSHHTLTILRLLRNTIHGQMMRTTAVNRPGRVRETVIRLPSPDEASILSSIQALDSQAAWGVRTGANGSALVDPAAFVERFLPHVLTLLEAVMALTPVERLNPAPATGRPSIVARRTGTADWYGERNRLSIRWQLGF